MDVVAEAEGHLALEHDLFVFDVVVDVGRNSPPGSEGKAAGREPGDTVIGAKKDLDRGPARALDYGRGNAVAGTDDRTDRMLHETSPTIIPPFVEVTLIRFETRDDAV